MENVSLPLFLTLAGIVALSCVLLVVRGIQRFRAGGLGGAVSWWIGAIPGPVFIVLLRLMKRSERRSHAPLPAETWQVIGALAAGVIFLIVVLGGLLPTMLDALERRSFASFVGARHVRATKSGFLTVIAVLSMAGVAVSSCALCSVTSIMGGFGYDLKRKILGNNAHIVVDVTRPGGFSDWETKLAHVRVALAKNGDGAATPVVGGEAMGSSASNTAGVLVRGIDPDSIGSVIDLKDNIEVGKFEYFEHPDKLLDLDAGEVVGRGPTGEPWYKGPDFRGSAGKPVDSGGLPSSLPLASQAAPPPSPSGSAGNAHSPGKPDATSAGNAVPPDVKEFVRPSERIYPGVILGRELAKSLHVQIGDEITLLSPMGDLGPTGVMPRSRRFRVAAIFYSGMYEYDASHAYIMLKDAQRFFSLTDDNVDRITNIDIRVPDPERVKEFRPALDAAMGQMEPDAGKGAELRVRDWMEMNKNLFSALKLERIATFIILSLAIMVASFCIVCTLLLMVTEKGKEIAILKALGASDGSIMRVFMLEGVIIGGIGTVFGVGTALAACTGLAWFGVRLDPDVYYIERLPVNVNGADYAMVALAAFIICTISTIYPAYAASKLRPVDGLRWE